jgi:hypothetical protein
MTENESTRKAYNFDYAAVKTAVTLDEIANFFFFGAWGFRVERAGPIEVLLPDYRLISKEHPEIRIRLSMMDLIRLRSMIIERSLADG